MTTCLCETLRLLCETLCDNIIYLEITKGATKLHRVDFGLTGLCETLRLLCETLCDNTIYLEITKGATKLHRVDFGLLDIEKLCIFFGRNFALQYYYTEEP